MENQTTMQSTLSPSDIDLSFLHEFPTDWVPHSSRGWRQHQILLEKLTRFALSRGWTVEWPEVTEDSYGDGGVDIILNGWAIDQKSFPLTPKNPSWASRTLDCPAWIGKKPNPFALTDWLVFGTPGSSPETWEVARFKHMKPSLKKPNRDPGAPYFWNKEVMSFSDFAQILDSRNDRESQLANWHNGACVTA